MKMTIKNGDNVVVISGKEKGKTGKVLEVFPETNRVLVDGVNIVSRHTKARSQTEKSGIVKKSAPIDASNVMVVCSSCGKATRIHHKMIDGKKVRVCKCGVSLDKEFVKATKKDAKKDAKETSKTESKATAKKTTKSADEKVKAQPKTAEKKTSTAAKSSKPVAKKATTQKSKTEKKDA